MLKLHFHPSPNPMKIALFLAEAGLDYELVGVDTRKGEQHAAAFRAINPNRKTPVLEDGGKRVFDSNAILFYLGEKSGKFLGAESDRAELLSWAMFVATGIGPYLGQCAHFVRFHADSPYATNRYVREAQRHLEVLDQHLAGRQYIVGNDYTIVDISAWAWMRIADFVLGKENALQDYPNIAAWFARINARPAVAQAIARSQSISFKDTFDEEASRALFPQNYH